MIFAAHGLGGLRDLIALVRSRPLPDYASHAAIKAGDVAVITFDCDLSAPHAQVTHALPVVTWRGVGQAHALMAYALNTACCAALCARLRALAARMRAKVA